MAPAKLFLRKPKLIPRAKLAPVWDGAYAKLVFQWQADASQKWRFTTALTATPPTLLHPQPLEQCEVDLHNGEFILRQTDFFAFDVVPLALARTYRSWDFASHAFGMGSNHPYDVSPVGDRYPYTFIDVMLEDGRKIHFDRISEGSGYRDAVYEHDDTSSEFYEAQFSWNVDHWDLRMHDGRLYIFPEAYHAKSAAQAAIVDMRDADGRRTQLLRDGAGNLIRVVSPSGHTLNFTLDEHGRIVQAKDETGKIRSYTYEPTGHLLQVSENGRKLYTFEYQTVPMPNGWDDHLMTGIFDTNGRQILKNKYVNARIVEQQLTDGQIYRYKYQIDSHEVLATTVEYPDGKTQVFRFSKGRLLPE